MNWFDLVLLFLLGFYTINGIAQGLLKQVVSLLGFFLALVIALWGSRVLAGMLAPYLPMEDVISAEGVLQVFGTEADLEAIALMVLSVFSFVFLFIVLQAVCRSLVKSFKMVNYLPLVGKINALGGGALGFLKGLLFVFILVSVLSLVPIDSVQAAVGGSELTALLEGQVSGIFQQLRGWFEEFFL